MMSNQSLAMLEGVAETTTIHFGTLSVLHFGYLATPLNISISLTLSLSLSRSRSVALFLLLQLHVSVLDTTCRLIALPASATSSNFPVVLTGQCFTFRIIYIFIFVFLVLFIWLVASFPLLFSALFIIAPGAI